MSNPLIEFLRARLDDDEQIAQAALPGPWRVSPDTGEVESLHDYDPSAPIYVTCDSEGILPAVTEENAAHIARHDPASVLREVEAKRRILGACARPLVEVTGPHDVERQFVPGRGTPWAEPVLRLLALPHSDHPDYLPGWAP